MYYTIQPSTDPSAINIISSEFYRFLRETCDREYYDETTVFEFKNASQNGCNINIRAVKADFMPERMYQKFVKQEKGDIPAKWNGSWYWMNQYCIDSLKSIGYSVELQQKLVYFQEETEQDISWNDGIISRSRQPMLLLYTKNKVYEFTGQSIPNICTNIGTPSYTKNGKWSNSTYKLRLAKGVKTSSLRQDWDSGRFINNHQSLKGMMKDLELDCTPKAAKDFLQKRFPNTWKRHSEFIEEIVRLEEVVGGDTIEYNYQYTRGTKRQGMNRLLIDGEVWCEYDNPMAEKVVIQSNIHSSGYGGGTTDYLLIISAECEIEEIYEYSAYGDEGLDSLGYVNDGNGKGWVLKADDSSSKNTPFEGLSNLFK